MKNKDLLYQMAFDLYDANNDDQISEMDLFKIFQSFGRKDEVYNEFVQPDLITMSKIVSWLKTNKADQ